MGFLTTEVAVRLGTFASMLTLMALWEALAPRRTLRVGRRCWTANLSLTLLNTVILRVVVPLGTYGQGNRVHHSIEIPELNKNFGFNFSRCDRILGTYRDQPAAGHGDMTNGLREHEDESDQNLSWMIALPFRRR